MSTRPTERVLAAPEQLGLESRTDFRRAAAELLEQLPEGAGRLIIDMSGTRQVDSAGLGALMLIQRRAAERRLTVCLRGANEELRFLLVLTKLDDLFERSEEHTSELQSQSNIVCRLLLDKKKINL